MNTNEKTRSFTVTVPEEDARRFITKCAEYGVAPADALAGFVAELVGGRDAAGSTEDARCYFLQKYDCGGYGEGLLQWAVREGYVHDFATDLDVRASFEAELEEAETPEEAEELRADIARIDESMQETYGEYVAHKQQWHEIPEPFEAAVKSVRRFRLALRGIDDEEA